MRGAEGLRHFSKSDLIRVTELATRKQYAAEQALAQLRVRFAVCTVGAFGVGFLVAVMVCTAIARG